MSFFDTANSAFADPEAPGDGANREMFVAFVEHAKNALLAFRGQLFGMTFVHAIAVQVPATPGVLPVAGVPRFVHTYNALPAAPSVRAQVAPIFAAHTSCKSLRVF